jgi:predicted O-methyltransferase YrrM
MSLRGRLKSWINLGIHPLGVRLETLAAARADRERLSALASSGHFDAPVFPILDSFRNCNPEALLSAVRRFESDCARFRTPASRDGYRFDNDYFTSPDAEVAYSMVRESAPRRIVEVGSGFSTRLFRAAIMDGGLSTELVSIDPSPRKDVASIADRVFAIRLQEVDEAELVSSLGPGDILFIDSSHKVETGNDVVTLLLRIVPALKPGVLIHLHDIFLPFEYPREWLVDFGWQWNEQYLVQASLQDSRTLEVLWPGHYLQRTMVDFSKYFHGPSRARASSLWLRKGDIPLSARGS